MYCPICGHKNQGSPTFCDGCGLPIKLEKLTSSLKDNKDLKKKSYKSPEIRLLENSAGKKPQSPDIYEIPNEGILSDDYAYFGIDAKEWESKEEAEYSLETKILNELPPRGTNRLKIEHDKKTFLTKPISHPKKREEWEAEDDSETPLDTKILSETNLLRIPEKQSSSAGSGDTKLLHEKPEKATFRETSILSEEEEIIEESLKEEKNEAPEDKKPEVLDIQKKEIEISQQQEAEPEEEEIEIAEETPIGETQTAEKSVPEVKQETKEEPKEPLKPPKTLEIEHKKEIGPPPKKDAVSKAGAEERHKVSSLQNGRYEILKEIGNSDTGKILLGKDRKMGGKVVMKEIFPPLVAPQVREYLEKQFTEEVQIIFRIVLKGFPRVIDFFIEHERYFIITEYIEGRSLASLLKEQKKGRFKWKTCLNWMIEILELLDQLHNQDPPIIHRDIKPSSIIMGENEHQLYLVDFGFAPVAGVQKPKATGGAYNFSSPENYEGKFLITSDIYSMGAVFHHLITGESPEDRDDPFEYKPIKNYIHDFPEDLQKIFNKMLSSDISKRYLNCRLLLKDLEAFTSSYNLKKPVPREKIPKNRLLETAEIEMEAFTNILTGKTGSPAGDEIASDDKETNEKKAAMMLAIEREKREDLTNNENTWKKAKKTIFIGGIIIAAILMLAFVLGNLKPGGTGEPIPTPTSVMAFNPPDEITAIPSPRVSPSPEISPTISPEISPEISPLASPVISPTPTFSPSPQVSPKPRPKEKKEPAAAQSKPKSAKKVVKPPTAPSRQYNAAPARTYYYQPRRPVYRAPVSRPSSPSSYQSPKRAPSNIKIEDPGRDTLNNKNNNGEKVDHEVF